MLVKNEGSENTPKSIEEEKNRTLMMIFSLKELPVYASDFFFINENSLNKDVPVVTFFFKNDTEALR